MFSEKIRTFFGEICLKIRTKKYMKNIVFEILILAPQARNFWQFTVHTTDFTLIFYEKIHIWLVVKKIRT